MSSTSQLVNLSATSIAVTVRRGFESIWPWLLRIAGAAATLAAGLFLAALLRRATVRALRGAPRDVAVLAGKIVYYSVAGLAGVAALAILGVNVTALIFAGGLLGVALGFASQTVVSSFLSGLFLYIDRSFKPGDLVKVGDVIGYVEDVSIFSTRLRSWEGLYVRIPNDKVFGSTVHNYYANVARRITYIVGISYSSDADKAVKVIREVLMSNPYVLREPEPEIFVRELADSSVNIEVKFWVPSRKWWEVKTQLLWRIKVALDEAGIEIPFPQRVVWLHWVDSSEPSGASEENRERS